MPPGRGTGAGRGYRRWARSSRGVRFTKETKSVVEQRMSRVGVCAGEGWRAQVGTGSVALILIDL